MDDLPTGNVIARISSEYTIDVEDETTSGGAYVLQIIVDEGMDNVEIVSGSTPWEERADQKNAFISPDIALEDYIKDESIQFAIRVTIKNPHPGDNADGWTYDAKVGWTLDPYVMLSRKRMQGPSFGG